jgi:hypothetical protein
MIVDVTADESGVPAVHVCFPFRAKHALKLALRSKQRRAGEKQKKAGGCHGMSGKPEPQRHCCDASANRGQPDPDTPLDRLALEEVVVFLPHG